MNITLKTLTPLWTGGVETGQMDRLHETGLLGSLRWWYEAIVRGLGGDVCDPTSNKPEDRCAFDEEKYRKSKAADERQRLRDAGVCDACQLFGCTGWARKFRLNVTDGQKLFEGQNVLIPSGRIHSSRRGKRAGGWFIFSDSRMGEVSLDFTPLRAVDLSPIHTILAIISRHASMAAKGSNGYGIVQAQNLQPELAWANGLAASTAARNHTLPDFRNFFFARFQFEEPVNNPHWWQSIFGIRQAVNGKLDNGSSPPPLRKSQRELNQIFNQNVLPIAPAIRNWLRYTWKHGLNRSQEQYVFGDARSAIGSKILVSYAYRLNHRQWEFRIWGWLPCAGEIKTRDAFLASLQNTLQAKDIWQVVFDGIGIIPNLVAWHALDCRMTDGQAYLQKLLGQGGTL